MKSAPATDPLSAIDQYDEDSLYREVFGVKGILNVHSENSLKECALSIIDICKRAKTLGAEAVCLTDHGSMTGIAEFISECNKEKLKPVPGVELELCEDGQKIGSLILMAKSYKGYVGLCKMISRGWEHPLNEQPVLDVNILKGIMEEYTGHIAASSGNVNGILGYSMFYQLSLEERKHIILDKISELKKEQEDATSLLENEPSINKEISELQARVKEAKKIASRSYVKKEENLEKLSGGEYQQMYLKIEAEKKESEEAKAEAKRLSGKITRLKAKIKEISRGKKRAEDLAGQISQLESELLVLTKKDFSDPAEIVRARIKQMQDIFGRDFFIDLMFHGLKKEVDLMGILEKVSREMGVRTFLSNDVHILSPEKEEIDRWRMMLSLKNDKWMEDDYSYKQYGMKTGEEIKTSLCGFLDESILEDSIRNMDSFFEECFFAWPDEKHYPQYHSTDGRTPIEVLNEKVREAIPRKYESWTPELEKRLDYELNVIEKTGYADYTMILSEIIEDGRSLSDIGSYIGPGRGSGAGSIVNYLAGITNIDPVKYGLIFERYLNIERISPPDIDSDIATSIREQVVHGICQKYSNIPGKVGVCSILTKSRLTARAAIRAAGRLLSLRMYGKTAGLYSVADKISKAVPSNPHIKLADCIDELSADFVDGDEQEIIAIAQLIEGCIVAYGTHAAGIIISDSGDVTDYAPLINMGTETEPVWNIQYDMVESESIGLLKLDALGLTTLDTNSNIVKRIYRTTGEKIDLDKIPFEKQVFREIYGKGNTNGVFQCESAGMKKMWTDLKPDCIEDIIAGISLFRPGPMDFIPDFINGKRNPASIHYDTLALRPILEETYGCIVYQEQVMRIVRDLAGYSMGRSDLVRRAMSKKKEDVMATERKNFIYGNQEEGIKGCIANGIPENVAQKIFDEMTDFAKYAFNKSHAAAYAILSYQSAWLKFHYPKEFLIETMNMVDSKKIPVYLDECRKMGFEVRCPDINLSMEGFTEDDRGNILFGLGNVKGVKKGAAMIVRNRDKPYCCIGDFLLRSGSNAGMTKMLIKSGAFDAFGYSRSGFLSAYDSISKKLERYRTLEKRIDAKKEKLRKAVSKKETQTCVDYIQHNSEELAKIQKQLYHMQFPASMDSVQDRLEMEKEALSAFVTVHPLDEYDVFTDGGSNVESVDCAADVILVGLVKKLRIFNRKADDQEMAVFSLEDRTGDIKVICLPEVYKVSSDLLKNDAVVKIKGRARLDSENKDRYMIFARSVVYASSRRKQVLIPADGEYPLFKGANSGYRVIILDRRTGQLIPTDFFIEEEELKNYEHAFVRNFLPGIPFGANI